MSVLEAIGFVVAAVWLSAQLVNVVGTLIGIVVLVAGIGALLFSLSRIDREEKEGTLFLEEDGLRVRTAESAVDRRFARASFESGVERPSAKSVALRLNNGVTLTFATDEPARILDHLGLSAAQRTATFELRRTLGMFTISFLSFFVWVIPLVPFGRWAMGQAGVGWGMLAALVISILIGYRFGRPRVVVGTDGVRVIGSVLRTFVPYTDIERVEREPFRVVRKDSRVVSLPMLSGDDGEREAVIRRIDQARAASGTAVGLSSLARGTQSMDAWRETIHRVVNEAAGFRQTAIGPEALEQTVNDASAPLDVRVGAAMALRVADESAAARIRVVADASVADRTRIALTAASEEDPDLEAIDRATRAR